jgi:hypothetical protein
MTDVLFEEIYAMDCEPFGDPERDKSRCLWAHLQDCNEEYCPILRQFRGKQPKDVILERTNLRKQYQEEMDEHA